MTAHESDAAVVIEPKGAHDLDGWTEITCWQAEIVRRVDLNVASSFTDMDKPDVFTEWWTAPSPRMVREVPVLREYRDRDGCRHYLANEPSKSAHLPTASEGTADDPIDNAACTCGRAWEGHPNPHSIICPLHVWQSDAATKETP